MSWRITARSSILWAAFALSGCLAHERPDEAGDAGPMLVLDASFEARDVSIALAPDAGQCARDRRSIGVRVVPVDPDAGQCTATHAEGASLLAIDAAPADDGMTLHFDLCPAADADCRCDVVLTNVGQDLAATLAPATNLRVDLAAGDGSFPGPFLAITKVPTCQCDACGCSEPLYLYAATEPPDSARSVPAPMTFSQGAVVCPSTGCSYGGSWMLHARGDAGELDVPGGTDRDVGSVHVRSVRDIEIFAPCSDCATCDTPVGAWVAWVSSV